MSSNNRRIFLKKAGAAVALSSLTFDENLFTSLPTLKGEPDLYFSNGIKIAEVTTDSAIFWTRLCADRTPKPVKHERREEVFRHPIDFDENGNVPDMDGAVAGKSGMARVKLRHKSFRYTSEWIKTDADKDHTIQIEVANLKPNTRYDVLWEAKSQENGPVSRSQGQFTTAPAPMATEDVSLVTSTCQYFWSFDDQTRGFRSYDAMRQLKPDFFIHTGDYIYYDKPGPMATNTEKARHKWHAMNGWPSLQDLFAQTPIYMLKDDHDLLRDDVDPSKPKFGELTYTDGLKIWSENAPLHAEPYRTIRWGKNLQIWLLEGREFRSKNKSEDGPQKTILGAKQKQWLEETVSASDATFKLLFSATPVVGPDRPQKTDNHANKAFETEGKWLRNLIAKQNNMYVVNGDRHWQYVSQDADTKIMEFGSGPVSDFHVQGWDADDVRPEHRFLRLKGGFLGITVKTRPDKKTEIAFTHYDVNGQAVHRETFEA
ncbi:alkaline phosphatase D [Dyadobacter jejuensis]|uniref:Alkaline phosphatase D n=1 Tax=Dyadobacter jejuensis TaxID=1082580 RepID=A0A316ANH1_9BACT|nr:alkaline phosphatase D family protein [Dyadobacter jejuensis]PWJ59305.1 alkaline phosphatase D [Dyadobacter jejuensis]